jgi:hypothetical protein
VPHPQDSSLELALATRLWFAWVCLIRVLFDPSFAGRVWALRAPPKAPEPTPKPQEDAAPLDTTKGLQLLALLQRDGRFVDFLEQDVTKFSDEEVGVAARIVHEGCRKVLHRVTSVSPVRSESEGTKITIGAGFSPAEITLVGNVQGAAPYRGTLRHRGWRASELNLPDTSGSHDPSVLAPAEIEL